MALNYPAFVEISANGKRIEIHFRYSQAVVEALKSEVNGARFVPREKGGPYWTAPLEMTTAREIRSVFGDGLELGDAIKIWGRRAREESRNLQALGAANDAKLKNVPKKLRKYLRPFQRADVAFMAKTSVGNFNEQGLGKTIETIAAIMEAKLDSQPTLIVAPKTSLNTVWRAEIERWSEYPVFVKSGDEEPDFGMLEACREDGLPFWFVTTADQIRAGLPVALSVNWGTFVVDEFHKTGLTNISGDPTQGTKFGQAVRNIKRQRMYLLSGTPIGGKPIRLWGALNHMKPEVFTSKWRWAEQWLVMVPNEYARSKKSMTDKLKPEKEDQFYEYHAEYIVRRLKSEVLPDLPPKQYIHVWCDMLPAQKKQYDQMLKSGELFIEGQRLSAMGVLAEYARLKQFASAQRTKDMRPVASGKLDALIERLAEAGIDPKEPSGDAVAVVASASKVYIKWVAEQLNKKGIKTELITGDTKGAERADIVRRFQRHSPDSPRVVAVTTQAGGVAITMDRADTVHILDETWNPDDQVQLEDRIHRISRIHQVMCYYYRSKDTVEEAIFEVNGMKAVTNENVMDIQRQIFREAA
jgi:Zierdtviridae DNA helicase